MIFASIRVCLLMAVILQSITIAQYYSSFRCKSQLFKMQNSLKLFK
jgi:hypothetical protein